METNAVGGYGTQLKRGDGALKTVTLATVLEAQTLTINARVFTAHATVTTVANREFSISGDDAADAAALATCINDATYGVPGVTAVAVGAVVTLYNDGLRQPSLLSATASAGTMVVAAATEAFTLVGEVNSIDGPGLGLETIEATHMQSPEGYREFITSFKDAGEMTVAMNFVPSDSQQDPETGILFDFNNRTKRNWQLVFPDDEATTIDFAAYVSKFAVSAPVDNKLGASMSLRVSGALTWSTGG